MTTESGTGSGSIGRILGTLIALLTFAGGAFGFGFFVGREYEQQLAQAGDVVRPTCGLAGSQLHLCENRSWTTDNGTVVVALRDIDTSGSPVRAVLYVRDAHGERTVGYSVGGTFPITISGRVRQMRIQAIENVRPRYVIVEIRD